MYKWRPTSNFSLMCNHVVKCDKIRYVRSRFWLELLTVSHEKLIKIVLEVQQCSSRCLGPNYININKSQKTLSCMIFNNYQSPSLYRWPNWPLKTCPNSHHLQGALKFATQISTLLNFRFLIGKASAIITLILPDMT